MLNTDKSKGKKSGVTRYPGLDGLRGIAFFGVLLYNYAVACGHSLPNERQNGIIR